MKWLLAGMYALGAHRLWWLMFVTSAAVFAVLQANVPAPWSLLTSLPVVLFAYLLLSQRARWRRDEERERTTGNRRGPFD